MRIGREQIKTAKAYFRLAKRMLAHPSPKTFALLFAAVVAVLAVMALFLYLGAGLIIAGDSLALAFTWLRLQNPVVGWALLGGLAGGSVGMARGLEKVGRRSSLLKLYGCVALMGVLILLGAYFAHSSNGLNR
jgi:hypothetical protein